MDYLFDTSYYNELYDENVSKMIEVVGERLCLAPASTHSSNDGCYRGGLVQNALMITSQMRKLNDLYALDLPIESIIKVGLFHDIGRVGDLEDDLLIDQDSVCLLSISDYRQGHVMNGWDREPVCLSVYKPRIAISGKPAVGSF